MKYHIISQLNMITCPSHPNKFIRDMLLHRLRDFRLYRLLITLPTNSASPIDLAGTFGGKTFPDFSRWRVTVSRRSMQEMGGGPATLTDWRNFATNRRAALINSSAAETAAAVRACSTKLHREFNREMRLVRACVRACADVDDAGESSSKRIIYCASFGKAFIRHKVAGKKKQRN